MCGRTNCFLEAKLWLICLFSFSAVFYPSSLFAEQKDLSVFIDEYAKKNDFNGTLVVQKNGVVVYQNSYGLANRSFAIPNRTDTKYKIASITKLFTAVLILQLRDQGRLDLNATINNYLPNYAGEAATKVTIHQLLNHTSGMANADKDVSPDKGIVHYQTPMTIDDLINRFYSAPLAARPGNVFEYNNADYILLGKIVETLYGKPFSVVLSERILVPLAMNSSGMMQQAVIQENLADTYFYRDDLKSLSNDLPVYAENWFSSGAMYSTAADLMKFSNALYDNRLIKQDSLALMLKPGLDDYGYGLWIDKFKVNGKAVIAYRRPGRIMGAQTMLIHYPGAGLSIIVLSNGGDASPDDFAFAVGKKILERKR